MFHKKALTHWHKMDHVLKCNIVSNCGRHTHSQSKPQRVSWRPTTLNLSRLVRQAVKSHWKRFFDTERLHLHETWGTRILERHYFAGIFLDDDSSWWDSDLFQRWWVAGMFYVHYMNNYYFIWFQRLLLSTSTWYDMYTDRNHFNNFILKTTTYTFAS